MIPTLWPSIGEPSRVRQILAYHNSPHISANQPRDFFIATAEGTSNRMAWLEIMSPRAGFGHNSPSLLTVAATWDDAKEYHQSAALGTRTGISSPPEDATEFRSSYLDYGCGPCCANRAPGGATWQDVDASAPFIEAQWTLLPTHVARLRMDRIVRTEIELAGRVAQLLDIAAVDPPDVLALAAWATRTVEDEEASDVLRLDGPTTTTWILYTPQTDDLLLMIERPATGSSISEAEAAGRFRELLSAVEARGLGTALASIDPRIGTLRSTSSDEMLPDEVDGWRFAANRMHESWPILDSGVAAVIRADGLPTMLRIHDVALSEVDVVLVSSTPSELAATWLQALDQLHRPADEIFMDAWQWAYVLPSSLDGAVIEPRLVLNYSLGYDGPEGRMPSRQNIMSLPALTAFSPTLIAP
jgi:hypothetical protein